MATKCGVGGYSAEDLYESVALLAAGKALDPITRPMIGVQLATAPRPGVLIEQVRRWRRRKRSTRKGYNYCMERQPITSRIDLSNRILFSDPGYTAQLTVFRGGEEVILRSPSAVILKSGLSLHKTPKKSWKEARENADSKKKRTQKGKESNQRSCN